MNNHSPLSPNSSQNPFLTALNFQRPEKGTPLTTFQGRAYFHLLKQKIEDCKSSVATTAESTDFFISTWMYLVTEIEERKLQLQKNNDMKKQILDDYSALYKPKIGEDPTPEDLHQLLSLQPEVYSQRLKYDNINTDNNQILEELVILYQTLEPITQQVEALKKTKNPFAPHA